MDIPKPYISGIKFTIEEAAKRCGVEPSTVSSWIKDGLPTFSDENGLERIESKTLSEYLQYLKAPEILTRFFKLDMIGLTWGEYISMNEHFFTNPRMESLQIAQLHSQCREEMQILESKLAEGEKEYGIVPTKTQIITPKHDFNGIDTNRKLSVKDIAKACGTTKKTVFSWKKDGLDFKGKKTKRGDLYVTMGGLISFLSKDRIRQKYLDNVLGYPLTVIYKNITERIDRLRECWKNDDKRVEQNRKAFFSGYINKIYDDIKAQKIKLYPVASKKTHNAKTKKIKAEKFLIENVITKRIDVAPDEVKEIIGKELLRKINILISKNKNSLTEITGKSKVSKKHIVDLLERAVFEEVAEKKFKNNSDKILMIEKYIEHVNSEGREPIKNNLLKIGLTSSFITDKLLKTKINPLKKIYTHFIPDKEISPSVVATTLSLLKYLDTSTADIILQLHFLKGKYRLRELNVYAICRFLHKHIWNTQNNISRHGRLEAVACLLNVRWQRVNEIIRFSDNKLEQRVNNLLNPNWQGLPDVDISNLFDTDKIGNNEDNVKEKDNEDIAEQFNDKRFVPDNGENGFSTIGLSDTSDSIDDFNSTLDWLVRKKASPKEAKEILKFLIRDIGYDPKILKLAKKAVANRIVSLNENNDDKEMDIMLNNILKELKKLE